MNGANTIHDAVDLSHHINTKSRSRQPSPLKDIIKYMGYDGMISLAGGLPHPSLFPLKQASFGCPPPNVLAPKGKESTPGKAQEPFTLSLTRDGSGDINLTDFLQYGTSSGNAQLLSLAKELTDVVHKPAFHYECLLHPGNTNAWSKVVGLLCEDDDYVLCDEYVYPSAQALWVPMGIKAAPVIGDAEGMRADKLDELMKNWDETAKSSRRPRVLYVVPVGSNPTGVSISTSRRKELYNVCVKHDIIVVEDDPYYFLQFSPYNLDEQTQPSPEVESTWGDEQATEFLSSLAPSFLSIDYQGRVIRLESFSKTLFPGLRLGYFISNPLFRERLLRASEVETQDPSGLSQAFVLSLLRQWGVNGYLQWAQNLRLQYWTRRNWLVDAIRANFELTKRDDGTLLASIVAKDGKTKKVFSFVDPEAGMFLWTDFYIGDLAKFATYKDSGVEDPEQAMADEVWKAWIDELVVVTPGSYYHPWQGPDMVTTSARGAQPGMTNFRLSFATPTKEQIEKGIERLRKVVDRYW